MIAVRHAWLQKHPSPAASGGEFHWYPHDGDRELRAACVERLRGVDPPAVLWEFAPGRVVWARSFAATAPSDDRRYVGLVLTIAERDAALPADLLAELASPPAAPWTAASPIEARRRGSLAGEPRAVVRALLSGGTARVDDPIDPELAPWIGSIERCMPASVTARTRRGAWIADDRAADAPDRVAQLAVAAWRDPASTAARAWRLLGELGDARGQSVDDVVSASDASAPDALSAAERAALPGIRRLVDVLHAWGRGRLDRCATPSTLTRLADAVALHVLARLAAGRDARPAIAEVRWYALLPTDRRIALLEAVAARAASLRSLLEVDHA